MAEQFYHGAISAEERARASRRQREQLESQQSYAYAYAELRLAEQRAMRALEHLDCAVDDDDPTEIAFY